MTDVLIRHQGSLQQRKDHVRTDRGQPSTSQGGASPNMPTPRPWTSRLQNSEKINCCLSNDLEYPCQCQWPGMVLSMRRAISNLLFKLLQCFFFPQGMFLRNVVRVAGQGRPCRGCMQCHSCWREMRGPQKELGVRPPSPPPRVDGGGGGGG